MSNFLFLDDYRVPSGVRWVNLPKCDDWDIVRNYDEFVDHIKKNGIPDFVAYDHDLADEHYSALKDINYESFTEKTGLNCAKFLVELCASKNIRHPKYVVHSMNPEGKRNIESYINSYNKSFDIL
jgi:hypothetical protein